MVGGPGLGGHAAIFPAAAATAAAGPSALAARNHVQTMTETIRINIGRVSQSDGLDVIDDLGKYRTMD